MARQTRSRRRPRRADGGERGLTLILADSDNERRLIPQRLTGGGLRIGVRKLGAGPHCRHSNLRVLLVADVLQRVVKDLHAGNVQLAMVRPSTATESDDRLRLALPFTPEMFRHPFAPGVGDCLDPAAEWLGQGFIPAGPMARPTLQFVGGPRSLAGGDFRGHCSC